MSPWFDEHWTTNIVSNLDVTNAECCHYALAAFGMSQSHILFTSLIDICVQTEIKLQLFMINENILNTTLLSPHSYSWSNAPSMVIMFPTKPF